MSDLYPGSRPITEPSLPQSEAPLMGNPVLSRKQPAGRSFAALALSALALAVLIALCIGAYLWVASVRQPPLMASAAPPPASAAPAPASTVAAPRQ